MRTPPLVTILPSHPAEGWLSMNRYWEALARSAAAYQEAEFKFECPLEWAGLRTPRQGKWKLALHKQILYPWKVRQLPATGIAHVLDQSYAFLLGSVPKGVKKIITVHDLLPLREPDGLNARSIARFRARVDWVNHADLILSDSESTRLDLIELVDADPAKIEVLPLGADEQWNSPAEPLPAALNVPFIFSIGGYLKRKNLEILPEILERVRQHRPGLKLVRAGAMLPDGLRNEFHRRCGEESLIELGQVSDSLLARLYETAAATVIPSRYEGFGLPVLEAMARGCPVVSARTTSLPEVGGDVALYYEVDDAQEAATRILTVLNAEPAALDALRSRCLERARQFTWEVHFKKLLEVYRRVNHGITERQQG